MRYGETVTVVAGGPKPLLRQWYSDLARLVASSPAPSVVLLEGSSHESEVRVTVRPDGLLHVLRRSPASASVGLVESRSHGPAPPAHLGHEFAGTLSRSGPPTGEDRSRVGPTVDRIGIGSALGPSCWLGMQTFWVPSGGGNLWLARRFRLATSERASARRESEFAGTAIAADWTLRVRRPATFEPGPLGSARDWRRGGMRTLSDRNWFERPPDIAAGTVLSYSDLATVPDGRVETPAIVLGATGAGKTTYLAGSAAAKVNAGEAVLIVDLHGDLAPSTLARLEPGVRPRVAAVDAGSPPVPGVAALVSNGAPDRAAAHLVAALKRLSPDGVELYWGFRLERVFDTFVRLALEFDGNLVDVYGLLTDPARRDSARLATRSTELARFLDELAPVVRRNPEFLWSAATRLSKVALVPALRELLAPDDGGLPVEELLGRGRSLFVRLPFTVLGPEAAAFAATLVLGRVYLGVAASAERSGRPLPVSVFLDEVHAFSPRLIAEILSEGRKFGLSTVVATQYPARLSREVQNAARGALRGFVAFRVPRPAAIEVGGWLGLGPEESVELLPNLPTGRGLVRDGASDAVRPIGIDAGTLRPETDAIWQDRAAETRREFSLVGPMDRESGPSDPATERLLLAALSVGEHGRTADADALARWASELPGSEPCPPALLFDRLPTLVRQGLLEEIEGELCLTAAGERRVGLTAPTDATRETDEHRALLMATFRLFARKGYALEIVRQGRFDTTLPDARFEQLRDRGGPASPAEVATRIEQARTGWAWRFFHGRDVHVEAEVSGALRSERIRRGVRKALAREAFVLFVVGDAHRARRVRAVVRAMGLDVSRAQVWTLRVRSPAVSPTDRIGK